MWNKHSLVSALITSHPSRQPERLVILPAPIPSKPQLPPIEVEAERLAMPGAQGRLTPDTVRVSSPLSCGAVAFGERTVCHRLRRFRPCWWQVRFWGRTASHSANAAISIPEAAATEKCSAKACGEANARRS